jgi:hypothetical protein
MENKMKQLSFAHGNITEEDVKVKQQKNYAFGNITPKILSYPIRKCKFNKEGCIFTGDKNICLLTNKEEERCPK